MFYFIVNPVSKSGKGFRLWKNSIEPVLISKQIQYHIDFSKERGDVTNLCAKISSNASLEEKTVIVILGGDGSLNDAVQGICDFDKTILAYIPTGSSNDFARDMKISKSIKKVLNKILATSNPTQLDLGEVIICGKSRKFVVSSGIGFDAAVCQRSSHSTVKKNLNKFGLGRLTYLAIALNQIINAPKVDCELCLDGKETLSLKKFLFAVSMVHRYEGGGFMFCPKANAQDGKMNLCVVNGKSVLGMLFALPFAFFGLHKIFPGIKLLEFTSAKITTTIPLWLHTDGEVLQKANEIEVRTFEKKLKLLGL